ncbi:TetR/AcrR family transcriptional regulator [Mycolicibacterium vanbaalenii]|uniref:TetR/AcrR family transcriptional regulator n=1 Tax=Mycolicibacterium vanbaalenii TaxID=110539 RepID=UPI0013303F40|nr:TetR/AcrR family transcriptional regulator [Mycolicibacterium vanbaalenii]
MPEAVEGRRARKKAQTRRELADAARRLFLAKGYDAVSVKDIADAVDISVPTLFNHVPGGKEAVMFDDGVERMAGLLAAVQDRPSGQTVLDALREFMAARGPFAVDPSPRFRALTELIMNTPALRDYSRKLWVRCEPALAEAVAAELGRESCDPQARAVARFVLELPEFIGYDQAPRASLDAIFDLLEHGIGTSARPPAGVNGADLDVVVAAESDER